MCESKNNPWFKVIGMLQQIWAFVEGESNGEYLIKIVSDKSELYETISCKNEAHAKQSLIQMGFRDSNAIPEFLSPPKKPFANKTHPNNFSYKTMLE